SDLGCAQNADGFLKNASDIQFFHDVDDTVPISGPSTSSNESDRLHPFFSNTASLRNVVGSCRSSPRRSSRTSRPSAQGTDPNNTETAA
ncbi:hypothetical protein C8R45DRAFT_785265, partial [Mycena sanguinolenta]